MSNENKDNLTQRNILRPLGKETYTSAEADSGCSVKDLLTEARSLDEPLVSAAANAIQRAYERGPIAHQDALIAKWEAERDSAARIALSEMTARNGAPGGTAHAAQMPNVSEARAIKEFSTRRLLQLNAELLDDGRLAEADELAGAAVKAVEALRKKIQKEKTSLFSLTNPAIDGRVSGPEWDQKFEMLLSGGPSACRVLFDELKEAIDEKNGYDPESDNIEIAQMYWLCLRGPEAMQRWAIERYRPAVIHARSNSEKVRLESEHEQVMPRLLADIAEYKEQQSNAGVEALERGYALCIAAWRIVAGVDMSLSGFEPRSALEVDRFLALSPHEREVAVDPSWLTRNSLPWRSRVPGWTRARRSGNRVVREPYSSPEPNQLYKR